MVAARPGLRRLAFRCTALYPRCFVDREKNGGFTFAEAPDRDALSARILWCTQLDPGTLQVSVAPSGPGDEGGFEVARVAPWLTLVVDEGGSQHAVLSDGGHQIRLDVIAGDLVEHEFMRLGFRIDGLTNAAACVLPVQRLLALYRHGRFGRSLFPRDPLIARGIQLLRVHEALNDGASHRDIAQALFGLEVRDTRTDSLRSRVRRLVREARHMAKGAYRPGFPHQRCNAGTSQPAFFTQPDFVLGAD